MNSEKNKNIPVKQYKLMLKHHWETGISYLCITKRKDWNNYKGSGSRWLSLLKSRPSKIWTSLLYTTDCKEELAEQCLYYTLLFDIPNNKDFANVVPELGYEGNQGNLNSWWGFSSEEEKQTVIEKRKSSTKTTCNERYGYDYILQVPEIREAIKNTCLIKYGKESVLQVPEIISKCRESNKKTLLEKYGVLNIMKIPEVSNKAKEGREKTLLEKHGVKYPLQIEGKANIVKNKREKTLLEKYGVPNISMVEEHRKSVGKLISASLKNRHPKECSFCSGKYINIATHESSCKLNPNRQQIAELVCPNCNKIVDFRNAKRWHFDNCKMKGVK